MLCHFRLGCNKEPNTFSIIMFLCKQIHSEKKDAKSSENVDHQNNEVKFYFLVIF